MARNAAQKTVKDANGAAPAAAAAAPESIDQVRDLLFGGQMRMVDSRLQSLDERMAHETAAMRTEFERQVSDLGGSIRKELAQHAERLSTERAKRVEDLKALSAEIREALRSLEKRHQNLEEAAGLADAELRDHLLKQGAAISGELTRTSERLSSELNRITTALQSEKLDSSALISGLTELAGRLGGSAPSSGKRPARA
jgi:gas vesicle protein